MNEVVDLKTVQVILSGRVQGVGMRFFINRNASKFEVNGYVKNQYNGTVFILMQADDKNIDLFMQYIKSHAPGRIDTIDLTELDTSKKYSKFQVKLF
jgi:acylphosphatase